MERIRVLRRAGRLEEVGRVLAACHASNVGPIERECSAAARASG